MSSEFNFVVSHGSSLGIGRGLCSLYNKFGWVADHRYHDDFRSALNEYINMWDKGFPIIVYLSFDVEKKDSLAFMAYNAAIAASTSVDMEYTPVTREQFYDILKGAGLYE